jgi:hypothetical protein
MFSFVTFKFKFFVIISCVLLASEVVENNEREILD